MNAIFCVTLLPNKAVLPRNVRSIRPFIPSPRHERSHRAVPFIPRPRHAVDLVLNCKLGSPTIIIRARFDICNLCYRVRAIRECGCSAKKINQLQVSKLQFACSHCRFNVFFYKVWPLGKAYHLYGIFCFNIDHLDLRRKRTT